MQLPTLRRPVAASALAGIVGAGILDALLAARSGAPGQVFMLALGLYGAVALLAAFGAALLAAALDGARPPGWGTLRDEPNRDRAVAAGILACLVGVRGRRGRRRRRPAPVRGQDAEPAARDHRRRGPGRDRGAARRARRDRRAAAAAPDRARPPPPARARRDRRPADHARGRRRARLRRGAVARRLARARSRAAVRARRRARARRRPRPVLVRVGGRPWAARAPAGAARVGAVVRAGGGDVRLPDHRGAPARRVARIRRRRGGLVGHAPAAGRGAARHRRRRRRLLRAFRRRRLRRQARRRLPGRGGCRRQRRRRELRGRRREGVRRGAGRRRVRGRHRPRRAARRRLQGQPAHHHDRCAAGGSPGRRRLRPPGRALADADARRAGAQGRVFPARLVAGAQHPEVVPGDPDRPLPVGHRVGQAGHELSQPAAHQSHLLRDAGRRGLEADRHLLALLLHARPGHQPRLRRMVERGRGDDRRVEQGHRVAAHRSQGDRTAAPGGRAQGTLRAVDAPVRAALVVHDAQGIPDVALGRPGPAGEVRLRDRVLRFVGQEADRRGRRARPRRQHGDRRDGRSRRGVGRAQGLLPRPGSVRRAAARAADLRRPRPRAPGHRRTGDAGGRGADRARPGRRADPGEHARAQPAAAHRGGQGGAAGGAAPAVRRAAAGDRVATPRDDDGRRQPQADPPHQRSALGAVRPRRPIPARRRTSPTPPRPRRWWRRCARSCWRSKSAPASFGRCRAKHQERCRPTNGGC